MLCAATRYFLKFKIGVYYITFFSGLNEFVPENLLSVFDEYELEVTEFPGVLISYQTFCLKARGLWDKIGGALVVCVRLGS